MTVLDPADHSSVSTGSIRILGCIQYRALITLYSESITVYRIWDCLQFPLLSTISTNVYSIHYCLEYLGLSTRSINQYLRDMGLSTVSITV